MTPFRIGDWVRRRRQYQQFSWTVGDTPVQIREIPRFGVLMLDISGVNPNNNRPYSLHTWDAHKFELVNSSSDTDMEGIEEI